jgi:hypothetical protein
MSYGESTCENIIANGELVDLERIMRQISHVADRGVESA